MNVDFKEFSSETLKDILDSFQDILRRPFGHPDVRRWGCFHKLFWWGGRWCSSEALATVAMKISFELYRREQYDHPFWSTINENGQSGFFWEDDPRGPWWNRPSEPYIED